MNDPSSKDDELTLELVDAIEQRSDMSQRHLAAKLGIALGLTNSYLKRCARKGLVKVKEVPANRYLYYLTPKGFAEKSRLTAKFLSTSLTFYRQSAESCSEVFRECERQGWRRVVLCGVSDLAEIACTRAAGHRDSQKWSSADKFAVVVETASMNEAEPGEHCRRRGLYPEQIVAWREACLQANANEAAQSQAQRKQARQTLNKLQSV